MYRQIAIDGPAASGKRTVGKSIAKIFQCEYIDTGAMYRAVTLKALRLGIDLSDEKQMSFIHDTKVEFKNNEIYLDGENVSAFIRTEEVDNAVATIAAYETIREGLDDIQKEIGKATDVVMDGRDVGTAIFPNAQLKIYLTATPEERARRSLERSKDTSITLEEMAKNIAARDKADQEREVSPLTKAPDAVEVDTTGMPINKVLENISNLIIERGLCKKTIPEHEDNYKGIKAFKGTIKIFGEVFQEGVVLIGLGKDKYIQSSYFVTEENAQELAKYENKDKDQPEMMKRYVSVQILETDPSNSLLEITEEVNPKEHIPESKAKMIRKNYLALKNTR